MTKNIVVLDGSPKTNGFTKELFTYLDLPEDKYEYLRLKDLAIGHCIACDYCKTHYGKCVIQDDMTEIYNKLMNASGIIVLTPVYFNSVSSLMKQLIDRTQVFFYAKYHFKKSISDLSPWVITISTGGAKSYPNQFLGVELALEHFYKNLEAKEVFHYYLPNTDRIEVSECKEDIIRKFQPVRNDIIEGN